MKFGLRKPSFKRSLKARTTGRLKRSMKRAVNPFYGKKGMGWINNPKKAAYNAMYNKTTFSAMPKGSQSQPMFQTPVAASGHPENDYFVWEEKVVTRSRWNYGWCLAVFLLLINDLWAAVTMTVFAYLIIQHHNKKPREERKREKRKLTNQEIINMNQKIEQLYESLQYNINRVNTILDPELYFEAVEALGEIIPRITHLINTYHLPFDFSLGVKLDSELENRNVDDYKNIFDEATEHFIDRYYHTCKESALRLKTETGFNNRMARNKETLLLYKDYLNANHLELLESLWSEAEYRNN